MWINSPLGKWEQDARVNEALRRAERIRAQEEAGDADGAARRGGLLEAASARLHRLAARTRGAIEGIQTSLTDPAAQQDEGLQG
jgi:hypothetical protein